MTTNNQYVQGTKLIKVRMCNPMYYPLHFNICWNKDYCTHMVGSCKSVLINIMSVLRLIVAGVQCVCVVVVYRTVYVYGLVLSWYTWVYM